MIIAYMVVIFIVGLGTFRYVKAWIYGLYGIQLMEADKEQ